MDLEKLAQDIKLSLVYTTSLKSDNETLHGKIASLEDHIFTITTTLKYNDDVIKKLTSNLSLNENAALDKVIALQDDRQMKDDYKELRVSHEQLEREFKDMIQNHQDVLQEVKEDAEVKAHALVEKYETAATKTTADYKMDLGTLKCTVRQLQESAVVQEKQMVDQQIELQGGYEEKLQVLQRSASSSINVDIYKRKLAAQRLEIQGLEQQLQFFRKEGTSKRGRRY